MSTTNGFATVIQVSEGALNALSRVGHALGTINHATSWMTPDDILQLAADAPVLALDPTGPPGEFRLNAVVRCLCHRWTTLDPLGSHMACAVTVNVRGRASFLPAGDPAPLSADSRLTFDESSTTAADVQFPVPIDPAAQASIAVSIANLLAAQGQGQASFNSLSDQFASAGLRVLPAAAPFAPVIAVGLNRAGSNGTAAGLSTNFCGDEWAIAIDSPVVLKSVLDATVATYGALPPPKGASPVVIDSQQGKVTFLDSFDAMLLPGKVSVSGVLREERGGPFGTVTGNFTVDIVLDVDPNGDVRATVGSVNVSFGQWYAVVGNFLSGGRFAEAITTAVREALSGQAAQMSLVDQLKAITQEISSAGIVAIAPVRPIVTSVSIVSDAVILQGSLGAWARPVDPELTLRAHLGPSSNELVLDASGSWMPGGSLATLQWDFGDGTSILTSGFQAGIAVSHLFARGGYVVRLTATNGAGRSSSTTLGVTPGHLYCSLNGSHPSQICISDPNARVMVSTSGCIIGGAVVKAEGLGWSVYCRTDATGQAVLQIDPADVAQRGLPGTKPSQFHLGMFRIVAERPGYVGSPLLVWMVDCDALHRAVEAAKKRRAQILDRLAGYAALSQLLERDAWLKATLENLLPQSDGPQPTGPPYPPFDPSRPELDVIFGSLKRSLVAYAELEHISLSDQGAVMDIREFKIPDARMLDRMTGPLMKEIDRVGRELDTRFGPRPDDL
jgi:hypothetical protein